MKSDAIINQINVVSEILISFWGPLSIIVPRTFSSFKMAGPKIKKYSQNLGIFCHVADNEIAFSQVISSDWQPFCCQVI